MSFELMAKAINVDGLSTTEKFIFLMLCNYADDEGRCFPKIDTISKKCATSPRTVNRAIASLMESGHLEKENRFNNGMQTSNLYTVRFPKSDQKHQENTVRQNDVAVRHSVRVGVTQCQGGGDTVAHKPINEPINEPIKKNKTKKGSKKTVSNFEIPLGINPSIWDEFEEMRNKKKKEMTDSVRNRIVNKLKSFNANSGDCPNAVLERSIINCWTDVYSLQGNNYKNNRGTKNGNNNTQSKKSDLENFVAGMQYNRAERQAENGEDKIADPF